MIRSVVLVSAAIVTLASCGRESGEVQDGVWRTEIGSGPITVIMLHGGPGLTHRYLRPEWDQLADVARVVYYDQRGCGWSERTDSVTWQGQVADLDALVTSALPRGPVVLAGSSWGSILGVLYASEHPDRVSALVLSGVPDLEGSLLPLPPRVSHDRSTLPEWADSSVSYRDSTVFYRADSVVLRVRVGAVKVDEGFPSVIDSAAFAGGNESVLPELAARMGMSCPFAMAAIRSSLNNSTPPPARLLRIDVPVLILRGSEGTVVGDGSEQLAALLPNARIETIPESGHDPWFEQPRAFFEVVRGLLVEVEVP